MKNNNIKIVIGVVVIVIVAVGIFKLIKQDKYVTEGVIENNELRVGYIIYPPLLTKDANTGELSGISYDLVEEVAKELGLTANWVEEVGWGTAIEGLDTGRYDVLGTQMWPNEAREKKAVFSVAPMNSVIYPYVKKGDDRYSSDLSVINAPENRIIALDGEMAVFIAQEDYPKATLNTLSQLSSYAEVFLNITQNKADISFAEPSAAEDFLNANPGSIERVGNEPVRSFGNSFAFDKENTDLHALWNKALNKVIKKGAVEKILEKYDASSHYSIN